MLSAKRIVFAHCIVTVMYENHERCIFLNVPVNVPWSYLYFQLRTLNEFPQIEIGTFYARPAGSLFMGTYLTCFNNSVIINTRVNFSS